MSRRAVKPAIKRPPADQREPVSTARPPAPLSEAELDGVVGGVGRQAQNTQFGSIVKEGMSKEPSKEPT
jgi:hypothetical protein